MRFYYASSSSEEEEVEYDSQVHDESPRKVEGGSTTRWSKQTKRASQLGASELGKRRNQGRDVKGKGRAMDGGEGDEEEEEVEEEEARRGGPSNTREPFYSLSPKRQSGYMQPTRSANRAYNRLVVIPSTCARRRGAIKRTHPPSRVTGHGPE